MPELGSGGREVRGRGVQVGYADTGRVGGEGKRGEEGCRLVTLIPGLSQKKGEARRRGAQVH